MALGFILHAGSTPVQASSPPVGPTAIVSETQAFPDRQGTSHYLLRRQGQVVSVLLSAVMVPCPTEGTQLLFTAPDGYRPATSLEWPVDTVRVVNVQGQPMSPARYVRPRVQVSGDGQVHLVADCSRSSEVFLHYATQLSWTSNEPMLWIAGDLQLPPGGGHGEHASWRRVYQLERLGSTVHARLYAWDLPLTQPVQSGQPLFQIPYGFRPAEPVIWPMGEEGGAFFEVQVSPQGRVAHGPHSQDFEGEAWHEYAGIAYNATVSWATQDAALIATSGDYLHQPVGQGGTYHLIRRGHTVWAVLMADATPVPNWVRPATARSQPQLSVHPETPPPHSSAAPDLNIYPTSDRKGMINRVGSLAWDPAVRYDLLGRTPDRGPPHHRLGSGHDWQIRFGEGEVGWVDGLWVQLHGVEAEIPVTDRLFPLPGGFTPAQDVHWVVEATPVDAQGRGRAEWPGTELGLLATRQGLVRHDPSLPLPEPGYQRYITAITWTSAADVCFRSWPMQQAIAKALPIADSDSFGCYDVSWRDLASIETLELEAHFLYRNYRYGFAYEPIRDHDLSGMSQLRELHIRHGREASLQNYGNSVQLPPWLLSHVPQLQVLTFENTRLTQLPPHFLVHTPQLQILNLALDAAVIQLPVGFLAFTPQLQSLSLDLGPALPALPIGFLAHAPRLQHLDLGIGSQVLSQLPPAFLTDAAQLETVTLRLTDLPHDPLTVCLPRVWQEQWVNVQVSDQEGEPVHLPFCSN